MDRVMNNLKQLQYIWILFNYLKQLKYTLKFNVNKIIQHLFVLKQLDKLSITIFALFMRLQLIMTIDSCRLKR